MIKFTNLTLSRPIVGFFTFMYGVSINYKDLTMTNFNYSGYILKESSFDSLNIILLSSFIFINRSQNIPPLYLP